MKKSFTSVAIALIALIALVGLFAGCLSPIDSDAEAKDVNGNIPYKAYIVVTPPEPVVAAGALGKLASISATDAKSLVNFHELILQRRPTATTFSGEFSRDAKTSGGGSLVVPVQVGAWYDVYLLQGYKRANAPGNQAVLLQTSYAVTPAAMVAGPNVVTLTPKQMVTDPTTQVIFTGMVTSATTATNPSRTGAAPVTLSIPNGGDVFGAVKVQFKFGTASGAMVDIAATSALNVGITSPDATVLVPNVYLKPYLYNDLETQGILSGLDAGWSGGTGTTLAAAAPTVAYASGVATAEWTSVAKAKFPTLTLGADGKLFAKLTYYPFVGAKLADDGTTATLTADKAAAKGWTKWTIQNGLDEGLDFANSTGGAVFVKVAGGSGEVPDTNGGSGNGSNSNGATIVVNM